MKGLLVKDFKLLKMQKNFFIIIVATAIGMMVLYEDIAFMMNLTTAMRFCLHCLSAVQAIRSKSIVSVYCSVAVHGLFQYF